MELARRISELADPVPPRDIASVIVAGLPESFNALVTVVRT